MNAETLSPSLPLTADELDYWDMRLSGSAEWNEQNVVMRALIAEVRASRSPQAPSWPGPDVIKAVLDEHLCTHEGRHLIFGYEDAIPAILALFPRSPALPEEVEVGRHSRDKVNAFVGATLREAAEASLSTLPAGGVALPDHVVQVFLSEREDGGLMVWSDSVPGLILSGADPVATSADIWPAIKAIRSHKAAPSNPSEAK